MFLVRDTPELFVVVIFVIMHLDTPKIKDAFSGRKGASEQSLTFFRFGTRTTSQVKDAPAGTRRSRHWFNLRLNVQFNMADKRILVYIRAAQEIVQIGPAAAKYPR